jgi:hypothetical protein
MDEIPNKKKIDEIKVNKKKKKRSKYNNEEILGWREWIEFPELGINKIKAKIDTGARTSALHATGIETFRRGNHNYVRFIIHPIQRNSKSFKACEAEMVETRIVKSSVGNLTYRPVIHALIHIGDYSWKIEITLVNRDIMGFRMLLGRQAIRGHFLVNPGKSYLIGKGKRTTTKRKLSIKRRSH